ncbi:MAG: PilZ domain-containing protein [Candidatus Sumerlaeaceae bacterium]|nr:PilZ domain-containing protein [Candidatus Sumerlaeaceae bacterium]
MLNNQRRHDRVHINLEVTFQILIPEDSFSPKVMTGHMVDLSERGAMVTVKLPDPLHHSLLTTTRYCQIVPGGTDELPRKLIGKAVWIQKEKDFCRIGLFFEDLPAKSQDLLRKYIAATIRNS